MPTKEMTLSFTKEKETKNKIRFTEEVEEGVDEAIGTLYMTKSACSTLSGPEKLTVTVKVAE